MPSSSLVSVGADTSIFVGRIARGVGTGTVEALVKACGDVTVRRRSVAEEYLCGDPRSSGRAIVRSCGRAVVWSCGRVVVLSHSRNRNNAQSLRTYVDQTKGFALATFGSIQGVYLAKKLLESGAWFVGWFGWGEDTLAVCVGRPWVG